MKLSIIICTFNRHLLLEKCLFSIISQNLDGVEVLVIDNNSTDQTKEIIQIYNKSNNNIKYYFESKIGLSNARNLGYQNAKADWILYLDDDAIAYPNMVSRALYLINLGIFDCVGGMYYGYFDKPKPKWIDENYGTKDKFSNELSECPFYIPHGGIVIYRKSILERNNGFNSNFGMKANNLGFGEETELQKRISNNGGIIMFDPDLKVSHLVKSERLSIYSLLQRQYIFGKNRILRYDINMIFLAFSLFKSIFYGFIKFPLLLIYSIFENNYYWQNAVLVVFEPIIFNIGRLRYKLYTLWINKKNIFSN